MAQLIGGRGLVCGPSQLQQKISMGQAVISAVQHTFPYGCDTQLVSKNKYIIHMGKNYEKHMFEICKFQRQSHLPSPNFLY